MSDKTPWAITARAALTDKNRKINWFKNIGKVRFEITEIPGSIWITMQRSPGTVVGFRMAMAPDTALAINNFKEEANQLSYELTSTVGSFSISINITEAEDDDYMIHYITKFTPSAAMYIPYWPKDILIFAPGAKKEAAGNVHVTQEGTRSGLVYFTLQEPKAGAILYLQNLSALSDYCEQTRSGCSDVVGGAWPELGFSLPVTSQPLAEGKQVVISDAIIALAGKSAQTEATVSEQFLDLLGKVYLHLPRPDTVYHDWPQVLENGLRDLTQGHACWSHVNGHDYFNAYVCDYKTPPEIMVQLAVMLPLVDYVEWNGTSLETIDVIRKGLDAFYDKKLKTIVRWLPAAENQLDGEEEQKKPKVMDSWYLHHPLLNLSRMALKGDKLAAGLFWDSLDYAIKVAHHFNYNWPVFYHMETLEVIKGETEPGKGGEKDVAGIYAHVMLQAYELSHEKRYLREAEKAAVTLKGKGFSLFYQANNTAFSAGAMLRLHKLTGKRVYLDLCYLCLANIFRNVHLWECNYGYGKNFPSFFALFPLSNAPYTAVYEEQEVFCAFHDFLRHAEELDLLPAVKLLVTEYIRYLIYRGVYYYAPMLPEEMLEAKPKTGELDRDLWIAVEDMQDGWKKCNSVGQEVYGAGNAFGILPRHFLKIPGKDLMVFTEYPITRLVKRQENIAFTLIGDARLQSRMVILSTKKQLPALTVASNKQSLSAQKATDHEIFYVLNGNDRVSINFSHKKQV